MLRKSYKIVPKLKNRMKNNLKKKLNEKLEKKFLLYISVPEFYDTDTDSFIYFRR